jgi:hypothetical protein
MFSGVPQGNGIIGETFAVKKTVLQSDIVAAGIDLTGVSNGLLELVDVILQNGSTAFDSAAHGATLNIEGNNVNGAPILASVAQGSLGANVTVGEAGATPWTTINFPMVLESGKKITAVATGEDFTSAGHADIYLIFKVLSSGATIAAAP